jgi:hypothetical protein
MVIDILSERFVILLDTIIVSQGYELLNTINLRLLQRLLCCGGR